MRIVYGSELGLGLTAPQNGVADPEGRHLLVLARGWTGISGCAGHRRTEYRARCVGRTGAR